MTSAIISSMPNWFRLLYALLWLPMLPLAFLRLAWKGLRAPDYWRHWSERIAWTIAAHDVDVWVHAVSVGETRAAAPLVRHFVNQGQRVLLTCTTPTGRATAISLYGDSVKLQYLPFDVPWLLARFFAVARPKLGLLLETELWPGVCDAARRHDVALWLVNARLSARSAEGYARGGSLSKRMLDCLSGIACQSLDHAARFRALGAPNVHVTGNIKFDLSLPDDLDDRAATLARHLSNGRPFWVFGSSREGEEALLLDCLAEHPLRQHSVAVIVPRHPERWDEVMAVADEDGYGLAFRTATQIAPNTEVIIGNSMGEMLLYYRHAIAVVMGGTLSDNGGQNLIEPCALGVPVVLGPSVFNFQQAADEAVAGGAAVSVQTPTQALDAILHWLNQPAVRQQASDNARAFVAAHRGATVRTLALIMPHCT